MDNAPNRFTFARTTGYLTAVDYLLSSDKRLKTKVEDLYVKNLDVDYKQFEFKNTKGQVRYGVIAQQLEKKYPELVRESEKGGMKSVSYNDLFVREIAYLKQENERLTARVSGLEKNING